MSRNRFEEIKRHLHFADNTKAPDHPPKDYKFSPLIDQFNKVANKIERTNNALQRQKKWWTETVKPSKTQEMGLQILFALQQVWIGASF